MEIIKAMLPVVFEHPNMDFQSVLTTVNFRKQKPEEVLAPLPDLREQFRRIVTSKDPAAASRWITGQLRKLALGNLPMRKVAARVEAGGAP